MFPRNLVRNTRPLPLPDAGGWEAGPHTGIFLGTPPHPEIFWEDGACRVEPPRSAWERGWQELPGIIPEDALNACVFCSTLRLF